MILRLQEHSTGIWAPVLLDRNSNDQLLGLSQVPVAASILQEAEVTVVRRDSSYEVVQEEMTGQSEAADEADQNHHDLKPAKSIHGSEDVFELHGCLSAGMKAASAHFSRFKT